MALLNQKAFERKLQNMSSTQDSIQTLSLWMIHHKKHADDMVAIWADQLKKGSNGSLMLNYTKLWSGGRPLGVFKETCLVKSS